MCTTGTISANSIHQTRVFIVDDHALIRDCIRGVLQDEPDLDLVGETGSAKVAADLIERHQPDVVLMDITLPGTNELETIQQVLQQIPLSKVLVLTMHENVTYFKTLLEAGVRGYLLKHSTGEELIRAIRLVATGGIYTDPALTKFLMTMMEREKAMSFYERRRSLTEREEEVLRLCAQGYTMKEIGVKLSLSGKTVETYRIRAMKKLGIENRAEILRYALKNGWL